MLQADLHIDGEDSYLKIRQAVRFYSTAKSGLIPTEKEHTITLPPDLYGKQVEILAFEISNEKKKVKKRKKFLDDIEAIPDFSHLLTKSEVRHGRKIGDT